MTTVTDKLSALKAIPSVESKKSDSKVPTVAIDKVLEAKLQELAALKAAMKDAEGHKALIESEVLPVVEGLRRELSIREHKHLTSINLSGIMTLIVQNKYSGLPESEESRLRQLFPGKLYEEFFKTDTVLAVDLEKISGETLDRLVAEGAVTKKATIKPTEIFHAARSTDSNVARLADEAGLKPVTFLKS